MLVQLLLAGVHELDDEVPLVHEEVVLDGLEAAHQVILLHEELQQGFAGEGVGPLDGRHVVLLSKGIFYFFCVRKADAFTLD